MCAGIRDDQSDFVEKQFRISGLAHIPRHKRARPAALGLHLAQDLRECRVPVALVLGSIRAFEWV